MLQCLTYIKWENNVSESITIFANQQQVANRITQVAQLILERYADTKPLFVCLLRGGVPFASRLMFEITAQSPAYYPEMEYLKVTTYAEGREAQVPRITSLFDEHMITDRTIVMIDDVLDTGRTPAAVQDYLARQGALAVDLVVLTQKRKPRDHWQDATICGFDLPDNWQIGMGCDDASTAPEAFRWAPYVGIVTNQ